jgi:uncharacterized phage protein (TIGR01671 family)
MREIKFRAWDKENKQMIYDVQDNYDGFYFYGGKECWGGCNCFGDIIKRKIPVMQYTGLKDKNRKEIYEGDIVEHPLLQHQTIVWYSNKYGSYQLSQKINNHNYNLSAYIDDLLITGNIYENPELLEKE